MTLDRLQIIMRAGNFSVRQIAILVALRAGPLKVRDLSVKLALPRPTVSRAADMLGIAGLAVRRRDAYRTQDVPSDARNVFLLLTRDGINFVDQFSGDRR